MHSDLRNHLDDLDAEGKIVCIPCAARLAAVQVILFHLDGTWTTWTWLDQTMNDVHRFAERAARLATWYACQSTGRIAWPAAEIAHETGLKGRALHDTLLLLGWSRALVWSRHNNRRRCRVWWAAPGSTVPRPVRGRPPLIQMVSVFY